jgi:serine protease Do
MASGMTSGTTNEELRTITRRVVDAAAPSVVRIGRHGGRGCGVVVGDGLVLTNAHNLRDRTTEVTFADGRAVQGRAAGVDIDGDLTVLEVDTGDAPPLAWAPPGDAGSDSDPLDWGATVFAVARVADGGVRVTSGAVSGRDRAFRGPRGRLVSGGVEHTAPLARGSSGSPIVDAEGRLLGVTTLRLGDGFSIARAADGDLRRHVDQLAAGQEPSRRVLGIGVAPARVARRMRQAVGLPERDGVLVRGVESDSPAARAGVQRGDLITAAGDREVADADDLFAALAEVPDDGTLTLHVVRGTDELDLTVGFGGDTGGTGDPVANA